MTGQVILAKGGKPQPPAAGKAAVYVGDDGNVRVLGDTGNESVLTQHTVGAMVDWVTDNVPQGYAFCKGQLLPVSEYPDLFAVLGTAFGGDGIETFAVPNIRSTGMIKKIIRVTGANVAVTAAVEIVPASIIGPNQGIYWSGDVLRFVVQLIEPVVTTGNPRLITAIGSNTYSLPITVKQSSSWEYEYTVQSVDHGPVTASVDLNGATLTINATSVVLDVHYMTESALGQQLVASYDTSIPAASTAILIQEHKLYAAESTSTPAAEIGTI